MGNPNPGPTSVTDQAELAAIAIAVHTALSRGLSGGTSEQVELAALAVALDIALKESGPAGTTGTTGSLWVALGRNQQITSWQRS